MIVTQDDEVARVLKLAAEIASEEEVESVAQVIAPSEVASVSWEETSLVLWQAPLPLPVSDADPLGSANLLKSLVDRGGQVIFFPPVRPAPQPNSSAAPDATSLFAMQWGKWDDTQDEIAVTAWRGDEDLLAGTLAGAALPVGTLKVHRRAQLNGGGHLVSDAGGRITAIGSRDHAAWWRLLLHNDSTGFGLLFGRRRGRVVCDGTTSPSIRHLVARKYWTTRRGSSQRE